MRGVRYDLVYADETHESVWVRVVWVKAVGLLFQWSGPEGTVQVHESAEFPPKDAIQCLVHGEVDVPYAVIQAARKYLLEREHIQAEESVVQQAMNRISDKAIRSEGRFQAKAREIQ
jgi:hypothetical protein